MYYYLGCKVYFYIRFDYWNFNRVLVNNTQSLNPFRVIPPCIQKNKNRHAFKCAIIYTGGKRITGKLLLYTTMSRTRSSHVRERTVFEFSSSRNNYLQPPIKGSIFPISSFSNGRVTYYPAVKRYSYRKQAAVTYCIIHEIKFTVCAEFNLSGD